MIKRYTKRNRIAEYNVGEIVYIINAESKYRKGKKPEARYLLLKVASLKNGGMITKSNIRRMITN